MKGFELYGASLYPAELLLEVPPSTDVVSPSDRAGGTAGCYDPRVGRIARVSQE